MADDAVDARKPDVAGLDIFFCALEKTIAQGARSVGSHPMFQAVAFIATIFFTIFAFGKPMELGWHYSASMPFITAALAAFCLRRFVVQDDLMSSSGFSWLIACLLGAAVFAADCTRLPDDGDGPVVLIQPGFVFLNTLVCFAAVYSVGLLGRMAVARFRSNYLECRSQALGASPAEVPAEPAAPVSEESGEPDYGGAATVRHGSPRPLL